MNQSEERRAILFLDMVSTQKYFLTRRPNSLFLPAFHIKAQQDLIWPVHYGTGCSRTNKNTDDLTDLELENMLKKCEKHV